MTNINHQQTLDDLLNWGRTPQKFNICPLFDEFTLNPREVNYSCFNQDYEECPIYNEYREEQN
jgi:hypothetical protein